MQPQFTDHRQTFDVRLFEGTQKRLDQPIDLEIFMERIDKNGKRISTRNETASNIPPKPLLPRWLNNILIIISTVFYTWLTLLVKNGEKNGKRISTRNETASNIPPKPLLPRWLNNILVIISTVFYT